MHQDFKTWIEVALVGENCTVIIFLLKGKHGVVEFELTTTEKAREHLYFIQEKIRKSGAKGLAEYFKNHSTSIPEQERIDKSGAKDFADYFLHFKPMPSNISYYSYEPMILNQTINEKYCRYLDSDCHYYSPTSNFSTLTTLNSLSNSNTWQDRTVLALYSGRGLESGFLFNVLTTLGHKAMWDYMINLYKYMFSMIIKLHNSTEGKNCPIKDDILGVLYDYKDLPYKKRLIEFKKSGKKLWNDTT